MLKKFAVPGGVRLVAVAPVYDELRQQGARKFGVDVRQAQNVIHVLGGLPLLGDTFGLGAVLQAGGEFCPLYADVLDKLGVQFLGIGAALAPVEDELGNGVLDEVARDVPAQHDVHGVGAGPPAVIQCCGLRDAERLCLVLLLAPPHGDDMLAKLVFPGVAGFAPLAPVKDEILQLVQRELARYVVVHGQQLEQVFTRRPVRRQQSGAAFGGYGRRHCRDGSRVSSRVSSRDSG